MAKQFNLTLTNRWKAAGLVVGGIGLLGLVAAATIGTVERYSPVAAALFSIGLLFSWIFWFIPRAAQKFCTELAAAILDEEGLTVHYPAKGTTRKVRFVDMASYSFPFNEGFTIRPHHGPALYLHLNHRLHPQGLKPLGELTQNFVRAVAGYQHRNPNQPFIPEIGFFSRPLATGVLVLFAALLGWEGWRTFHAVASKGEWGRLLLLGLLFSVYALAWRNHRKQPE